MIWPFDRKKKQSSEPELHFTNSASLFRMTCKYGHAEIELNKGVWAVVLDAKKEFGTQSLSSLNRMELKQQY